MGALDGIRVLEVAWAVPAGFCTQMLGDMGADVLKIQIPPESGAKKGAIGVYTKEKAREAVFISVDRNKRSIAINLRTEEGQQLFHKLVQEADILIEGFRPGTTKRLKADYETVKEINPKIIYCSLSGYGQDGPYRDMPGHDLNYISVAGALNLIGDEDRPPTIPLNFLGDWASAVLHGVIGILMALVARDRIGKGQYIDISYMDGVVALTGAIPGFVDAFFHSGKVPQRGHTCMSGSYPYYAVYRTKDDKFISIGCIERWLWENLCRAVDREDLIPYHFRLAHFSEKPDEKYEEAKEQLEQLFLTRTRDEWFELLSKHNTCVSKVYSWDEVFTDPQVLHRQMLVKTQHPIFGEVKQVGIPIKLSETPGSIRRLAPYLGEHTEEVLQELGCTSEAISELKQKGIVA